MTDSGLCHTAKKPKRMEIDRISGLPDDLISLILSFISTKEAVATSVLSKRWRSLWSRFPVLNFSSRLSGETESFLRFLRKRIRTLDAPLDVVRLQGKFDPRFGTWVCKLIASGVRELDLCMTGAEPIQLSRYGSLISRTLVSLRLERFSFIIKVPVHLPCLKILHLKEVGYLSRRSISEFISGCPVVEDVCFSQDDLVSTCPWKIILPPHLFTSQTLLSLNLCLGVSFRFVSSVHLPCLKILHLDIGNDVANREFASMLLLECTSLADLDMWTGDDGKPIEIPNHLFISKTLVSLKLDGKFSLHVPPSVHLPKLRILHLGGYASMLDKFLSDLLSGCPVLEEIALKDLDTANKESSSICVPTLERLLVNLESECPLLAYKLKITAPTLKYLKISCENSNGEIAWDLPNLEKAFVSFEHSIPTKLFTTIRNAKVLKLHHEDYNSTSPPASIDLIPKFQHLKRLEIDNPIGWEYLLLEILENSAELEKLVIFGKSGSSDADVAWPVPQNVPQCLLHSLKVFAFHYFRGLDRETKMVNYILRNGRVLEKIGVRFLNLDAKQKLYAQEKLSAIPRCSRTSRLYLL